MFKNFFGFGSNESQTVLEEENKRLRELDTSNRTNLRDAGEKIEAAYREIEKYKNQEKDFTQLQTQHDELTMLAASKDAEISRLATVVTELETKNNSLEALNESLNDQISKKAVETIAASSTTESKTKSSAKAKKPKTTTLKKPIVAKAPK